MGAKRGNDSSDTQKSLFQTYSDISLSDKQRQSCASPNKKQINYIELANKLSKHDKEAAELFKA